MENETCRIQFLCMAVALNATYALISALGSSSPNICTPTEIRILSPTEVNWSTVRGFRCLLNSDLALPGHCDSEFYDSISPGCASCTYSAFKQPVLSCIMRCSVDSSTSNYCQQCTSNFLTEWGNSCTTAGLQATTSISGVDGSACSGSSFQTEGGEGFLAYQLSTCLSVNQTRTIDCMTSAGFPDIPPTCSECLFSSSFVTDSACHSVCSSRPSSGPCMQCVNTFVVNTMVRCFQIPSFNLPFESACSDNDLQLMGPANIDINRFLDLCTDSVSCRYDNIGFAVGGAGIISDKCLDCLYVGEGRTNGSCTDYCASVTTDCAFSPLEASSTMTHLTDPTYPCTLEDLSVFDDRSRLQTAIHDCMYTSNGTATGLGHCLQVAGPSPPLQSLSRGCQSCMKSDLAKMPSCVSTCVTFGHQSSVCQECIGNAKEHAFSVCFAASAQVKCTLEESSAIAYESWALAVLQRCLLDTAFRDVSDCLAKAELNRMKRSFQCNVCLTKFLEDQVQCAAKCRVDYTSQDCRLCSTKVVTDMLKNCMRNPNLELPEEPRTQTVGSSASCYSTQVAFVSILLIIMHIN